jgi:hypothetical protein
MEKILKRRREKREERGIKIPLFNSRKDDKYKKEIWKGKEKKMQRAEVKSEQKKEKGKIKNLEEDMEERLEKNEDEGRKRKEEKI